MERYEKYKDSEIAWLGDIPEHWNIKKLKQSAKIFGRIGFRGYTTADIVAEGQGAITLSPSNISDGKMTYSNRVYVSWDKYYESPEIQVFSKDILFVKTGSTIGKVAIAEVVPEPMTINPQLVVIKEIKNHPNFLNYVMNSNSYQFQIMGLIAGGSTPSMTQENLGQTRIIAPPLEEQKTIAAFLDRKTAEIDELIAQKERLIALYEEEKTAIINEAVTKGINPDVKLKPTAIDWLGDIPEHWELIRQKFVFVMEGGSTPSKNNPEFWNGSIPWVSSKDMKKDRLNSSLDYITQKALDETSIRIHPEGKILIVVRGMILAHSFPVAVVLRCNGEESYD
jgi:type I restriction enzyme S subunit